MPEIYKFRDITGRRGESIAELRLTEYSEFPRPLFHPGALDGKWPVIDFYVELNGVRGMRPYFFVQVKTTSLPLRPASIHIFCKEYEVARLLEMPGPTYVLGVHEPSMRVFVKSVHRDIGKRGICSIQFSHELTPHNLRRLYNEVRDFWRSRRHKPTRSVFA